MKKIILIMIVLVSLVTNAINAQKNSDLTTEQLTELKKEAAQNEDFELELIDFESETSKENEI